MPGPASSTADPRIRALIALATGGAEARLERALVPYRCGTAELVVTRAHGLPAALAGYRIHPGHLELLHVATAPEHRHRGLAAALLDGLRRRFPELPIRAETDADAVGFYRRLGFTVTLLGEKYPGVERFAVCSNQWRSSPSPQISPCLPVPARIGRMSSAMTLELAQDSLDGLAVGDALGAQFFVPGTSFDELRAGRPPAPPWEWTDDTEMACSVVTELRERGEIDRDALAMAFAQRCEPYRGYGPGSVVVLHRIRDGVPWAVAAGEAFDGRGSWGNGAAMRVAPLGAFFAGDPDRAAAQAALSAEVTHRHPEAIAGAMAVAVAASRAAATRGEPCPAVDLLQAVEPYLIDGATAEGVRRATALLGRSVAEAAYELGNGARVSAADTVPFTLWAAATFLDDYPAAITACVEAGGDADTTAAIVGGIVAAHTGLRGVPEQWRAAREPLPRWVEHWPATLRTRSMTPADGQAVARWRYPGPAAVYDITEPPIGYTAVAAPDGTLLGFYCTGPEARVPGLAAVPGVTDIGVGLHPRWVGRGHGRAFAETVLAAVRREFPDTAMRAVVQEWNGRSRRLLENLGFTAIARHEAAGIGYVVLTDRK
ncbi:GNAT family N-acetyltransferase [Nocardia asteroides]|uniref:GNAT family N-acetyltransferase n=1 Tax=Nocardia asteroides TaxID=1824 RepID=UPI001E6515F8|nr:GNAT family N-acetyltransferase [Nocardia asteroides]UGT62709.1 GNAT family N-acetyltransferase [Nocardia asteroides]